MSAVNRMMMEQTSFDSAMPSGLGVVAHQLRTPGDLQVVIRRGGKQVRRIPLRVEERPDPEELRARSPRDGRVELLAEVDPVALVRGTAAARRGFRVFVDGYLTVRTRRPHRYVCRVTGPRGSRDSLEFDGGELRPGDIYAQTLVRPGMYSVTNVLAEVSANLTVSYPTIERVPYSPPDPIRVVCRENEFSADPIELSPAQCVIFEVETSARIVVDIQQPRDGPAPQRPKRPSRSSAK